MKLNKKIVGITLSAIILTSTVATKTIAADAIVNLKGYFSNSIRVTNNGTAVSLGTDSSTGQAFKPLVIDGRTYLPVRGLTQALGMQVDWDQNTSTVVIKNEMVTNYNKLLKDYMADQIKISELEKKIVELEKQLKQKIENESKVTTLKQLEDLLNEDYGYYKDIDFYIDVTGSTKNIEVKIYVDSADRTKWSKLTNTNVKTYVSDIVSDVEDIFPNAKVEGSIINEYSNKTEFTFKVSTSGKLTINNNSSSGNLNNNYYLEDTLRYDYAYNLQNYYNIYVDFTVSQYNYSTDIVMNIRQSDWTYLGNNVRRQIISDIFQLVDDEYYYNGGDYNNYINIYIQDVNKNIIDQYHR